MRQILKRAAVIAACGLGLMLVPAAAQSPAEFFKGKTVRLVNGGAPGSGFDLYSRMLAPWLERKLGASVVVESRPGAGMMIAMNHTWVAAPDGLTNPSPRQPKPGTRLCCYKHTLSAGGRRGYRPPTA